MRLHVKKNPDAYTLAICKEADDNDPIPNGFESMTTAEFAAWKSGEIAAGRAPSPAPLTAGEIAANAEKAADAAEKQAVKDMRAQLALDMDEATADQAEAQAFIDLNGAATATDRNNEIRNSAQRDKKALQRERRYARALRMLLKQA